jgi:hypothetical protein
MLNHSAGAFTSVDVLLRSMLRVACWLIAQAAANYNLI